jgi:serine phosphatase RsbU (regulator of sigma subunit)
MLVGGKEHTLRMISGDGPPLGITADSVYSEDVCELPENSRLLMYTDGLVELRNGRGKALGDDAVGDWLIETSKDNVPASTACASLFMLAEEHGDDHQLTDDITYLMFTENSQNEYSSL